MFKLVNSQTMPLTPDLAARFKAMLPSPTERVFDPARAKMLREKAEAGQLVTFNWATAKVGDMEYRVNGQHSSAVLAELNGQFPGVARGAAKLAVVGVAWFDKNIERPASTEG